MKRVAKLIGAGKSLPEKIVTSEEMEAQMGFDELGIRKGMAKILSGVSRRRVAAMPQREVLSRVKVTPSMPMAFSLATASSGFGISSSSEAASMSPAAPMPQSM